jgi:hypothetical protein
LKQKDYLTAEIINKLKESNLKRHNPHNTVAIGYERFTVEGYVEEIKVKHKGWIGQ